MSANKAWAALSVMLCASGSAAAAVSARPMVAIGRTASPPVMDGRLDDDCWRQAAMVSDFFLIGSKALAGQKTQALLAHDAGNLYVGLRCRVIPRPFGSPMRSTPKQSG